jgi:hypothetical protein
VRRPARSTPPFAAPLRGVLLTTLLAPMSAAAGPPYLTDDPQPTDPGHWEIYNFVQSAAGDGALAGEAGLDLNYGAAPNLQLTAVAPIGFHNDTGVSASGLRTGAGMIELAVKYQVLHQGGESWLPDLSLFPRVLIPTERGFGYERTNLFLPVWAQKDFGAWSVFGGGGYELNPGPGARDFWQGGVAVQRTVDKRLQLGAEVYGQTSDTRVEDGYVAVDLGAAYRLSAHWSLLGSAGPTWIEGGGHGAVVYASLKADY